MTAVLLHELHQRRKGDYYRYLAEFKTDQDKKDCSEQSMKGYEACFYLLTDKSNQHTNASVFTLI